MNTLVNLALAQEGLTQDVDIISHKAMPNADGTYTVKIKYTESGSDELKSIRKVYSLKDLNNGNGTYPPA